MAVVKRREGATVAAAAKVAAKPATRKPKVKAPRSSSELQLPTKKSEPLQDMSQYSILVYGPPKIGKTSFLASFPDILFFFFEVGGKALSVHRFPQDQECVETWEQFVRGVDLLEKTDRFSCVAIDTGAAAYQLCSDWVCKSLGINNPGNDKYGKRDRSGIGWIALREEFAKQVRRIQHTGRGCHFVAHSKQETIETRGGPEFHKILPRFTGQCEQIVVPVVDHIFYIDTYRLKSGGVGRVLMTKGDDLVTAGHKTGSLAVMPRYVLLPEDKPEKDYEVISKAFRGDESVGLRTEDLMVSASTSEAVAEGLSRAKDEAALARIAAAEGGGD